MEVGFPFKNKIKPDPNNTSKKTTNLSSYLMDKFEITNRIRNRIFIFANSKAKAIVKNQKHVRKNVSQ